MQNIPRLTLLCPGALASALLPDSIRLAGDGGWPAPWRRVEQLERFELEAVGARELPHEAWLRRRFEIPDSESVSAASALFDDQAVPVWRLTPACVHTGRDQLMLLDPASLSLSTQEADALAASLRPWIEEDGWQLTVATPDRWYLHRQDGTAPPAFAVHSSGPAIGQAIDAYLPFELAARPWRRLLNEIQMLWHEHPGNLARMREGRPPANTVWLEGAWLQSSSAVRPFDAIVTANPALAGLARLTQATLYWHAREAAPPVPAALTATSARPARMLVELDFWGLGAGLDPQPFADGWGRFGEWLARADLLARPGDAATGIEVVLTGERRCVALRVRQHAAWRFWDQVDPDVWLERLERPPMPPMPDARGDDGDPRMPVGPGKPPRSR